jgi:hypothetical protein
MRYTSDLSPLVRLRDEARELEQEAFKLKEGLELMITGRSISTAEKIKGFSETAQNAWSVLGAYTTHLAYDQTPASEIKNLVRDAYRALKDGDVLHFHSLVSDMQKKTETEEGKRIAAAIFSVEMAMMRELKEVEKDIATYDQEERKAMSEKLDFVTPEGEIRFGYALIKEMEDEKKTARMVEQAIQEARATSSYQKEGVAIDEKEQESLDFNLGYGGPRL